MSDLAALIWFVAGDLLTYEAVVLCALVIICKFRRIVHQFVSSKTIEKRSR